MIKSTILLFIQIITQRKYIRLFEFGHCMYNNKVERVIYFTSPDTNNTNEKLANLEEMTKPTYGKL